MDNCSFVCETENVHSSDFTCKRSYPLFPFFVARLCYGRGATKYVKRIGCARNLQWLPGRTGSTCKFSSRETHAAAKSTCVWNCAFKFDVSVPWAAYKSPMFTCWLPKLLPFPFPILRLVLRLTHQISQSLNLDFPSVQTSAALKPRNLCLLR